MLLFPDIILDLTATFFQRNRIFVSEVMDDDHNSDTQEVPLFNIIVPYNNIDT